MLKLSQIRRAMQMVRGQLISNSSLTNNAKIGAKQNVGVKISIRNFKFIEIDNKIKAIYTTNKGQVIKVGL